MKQKRCKRCTVTLHAKSADVMCMDCAKKDTDAAAERNACDECKAETVTLIRCGYANFCGACFFGA